MSHAPSRASQPLRLLAKLLPPGLAYGLYSLAIVLIVGVLHARSISWQLFLSQSYRNVFFDGLWSAPLDDVFIHFDFARSIAEGAPFQWIPGNGYSSGGTSLLYPFTLALGYRIGYRELSLYHFAWLIAVISCWYLFIALRSSFSKIGRFAAWLLPPILFLVGGLNWSLFSGMEIALHLAIWAYAFSSWNQLWLSLAPDSHHELKEAETPSNDSWKASLFQLSLSCLLLVASRPESALLVAAFCISLAYRAWKLVGVRRALIILFTGATPAACLIIAHAIANHYFTGESSAAGAVSKLELNSPFATGAQIRADWLKFFVFQLKILSEYHFLDGPFKNFGWVLWPIGLIPLFFRETRRIAILLWLSIVLWLAVIALNGQVRWQNNRYSMQVVAWLLILIAQSLALSFRALIGLCRTPSAQDPRSWKSLWFLGPPLTMLLLLPGFYLRCQEQLWFFGRASRNIFDQHIITGAKLGEIKEPPNRILLGDAGAIPYQSRLPALDIIGLGGYHDFPFARANRIGLGAVIELIQAMPLKERPQLMTIYPSWWGVLPLWFGTPFFSTPVRGNRIAGGPVKMGYISDWSALDNAELPAILRSEENGIIDLLRSQAQQGLHLRDRFDPADLFNEKSHHYQATAAVQHYVEHRLLPDPKNLSRDLWDAGRELRPQNGLRFQSSGWAKRKTLRLIGRFATHQDGEIQIKLGKCTQATALIAKDGWNELSLGEFDLNDCAQNSDILDIEIQSLKTYTPLYHLWLIEVD